MVFLVFMYGYECWTIKKADCWRINTFELWCRRRILRVPWTGRRSNQSILKEISPEYSLEGLMLKLKLQYFGHLMWITDSFEKTLMLEKIEGGRRRGWQRMKCLDSITNAMDMSLSRLCGLVTDRKARRTAVGGKQRVRHDWATELIHKGQRKNADVSISNQVMLIEWMAMLWMGQKKMCMNKFRRLRQN